MLTRRILAVDLDELVWEEVSTRVQDPAMVLEPYQDYKTRRGDSTDEARSIEGDDSLQG